MQIPEGWRFYTADFSCIARGRNIPGTVRLVRSPEQAAIWFRLPEIAQERTALYASGTGNSFEEALLQACGEAIRCGPIAP